VPNRRHYGGSTHNDPHLNPARRPRLTPARPAHLTLLFFCFQASPARALSPSLGPAGAYEVPLLEDQGRLLKHPSSSIADQQDCPPTRHVALWGCDRPNDLQQLELLLLSV
jgi:hypothetical protein